MFPLQAWLANLVGLHISAQYCHQHPKVLWVWGHLIFNSFKNHHRFRSTEKYCWLYISGSFADDNKCWVGALLDFQKSFFSAGSLNFLSKPSLRISFEVDGSDYRLTEMAANKVYLYLKDMSMWIVKMEKESESKNMFWKGLPDVEQLLGPDHPKRTCADHLPHLLQQQVRLLMICWYYLLKAKSVRENSFSSQKVL